MRLALAGGRRGSDRGAGTKVEEIGEGTGDVDVRSPIAGVHVERLGSCVRSSEQPAVGRLREDPVGCRVHDGEVVKDWFKVAAIATVHAKQSEPPPHLISSARARARPLF
eukprot:SAG11_NODE_1880_length_4130_cov_2.736046_3_plen_110_part_00